MARTLKATAIATTTTTRPSSTDDAQRAEQLRFMWLHQRHAVVAWRWLMGESYLRAYTDAGHTATIGRDLLHKLFAACLMRQGHGFDVYLTDAGRRALCA